MKRHLLAIILILSLAAFAAQNTTTPAPGDKAAPCACCADKAAGHTCSDCCKEGGACDKAGCCKDAKSCKKAKDSKAPCCGKGGCCHDKSDTAKAGSCCGSSCPRHADTHQGQ